MAEIVAAHGGMVLNGSTFVERAKLDCPLELPPAVAPARAAWIAAATRVEVRALVLNHVTPGLKDYLPLLLVWLAVSWCLRS